MKTEQLKPMDILADMTIPFDIAAYCRGHKFCVEAVELTRALHARTVAEAALETAEQALDATRERVSAAVASARTRMENDPHA